MHFSEISLLFFCGFVVPWTLAGLAYTEPLMAADWNEPDCDQLADKVAAADQDTIVKMPSKVVGKWVSEGCEVRPGPEYVLRSYTFHRNMTFKLLQFHYADESCSTPLFVMAAKGRLHLRGPSWLTPGASMADYTLTRVTVTPHSVEMARLLMARVNATCPGLKKKRWRPYREYAVLTWPPVASQVMDNDAAAAASAAASAPALAASSDPKESSCLPSIHGSLHELELVRSQQRQVLTGAKSTETTSSSPLDGDGSSRTVRRHGRRRRHELLLGDLHSKASKRETYRSTGFQPPLVRAEEAVSCPVCTAVSRGNERSPPQLHARPRLPAYLGGDWVSGRCEPRPLGLFLRRRMHFRAADRSWIGVYNYFSEPTCTQRTVDAVASGRYELGRADDSLVAGATPVQLRVERASVTVWDSSISRDLQADPPCGAPDLWQVGVQNDLSLSPGCALLGIGVPNLDYDIVRVDMDDWGSALLYFGQPDTDNKRRGPDERPTSYQLPLLRCRGGPPSVPGSGKSMVGGAGLSGAAALAGGSYILALGLTAALASAIILRKR